YVVACSAALFALRFIHPFVWIKLFATDYLLGFLFITGLVLTLAILLDHGRNAIGSTRALLPAVLAAVYVIAVPGLMAAAHVVHLSISDGRWWRFPCIAIAGLPMFIADEVLIRRIRS